MAECWRLYWNGEFRNTDGAFNKYQRDETSLLVDRPASDTGLRMAATRHDATQQKAK